MARGPASRPWKAHGKKRGPGGTLSRAGASSAFRFLAAFATSRKDSLAYQAVATAWVWLRTNC